jgi:signal transduction histidine kinase
MVSSNGAAAATTDVRADERYGEVIRMLIVFRLLALAVTIVYIPAEGADAPVLSVALVLAALASWLPLRYWDWLRPRLLRHPALLAADLLLTLGILALTGPATPFFYYTLSTVAIAGVAYGWVGAAYFAVLEMAGYAGVLGLRAGAGFDPDGFQELVGLPALYPLTAAAGAALRGILRSQADAESSLAAATLVAAASEERSRVAREMHDSLAKTLHGVSLSATALARRVHRDPDAAAADAELLAGAAERAAAEARELITDLRADQLEAPLGNAVRDYVTGWSGATGIPVRVHVNNVELRSPSARYELFGILREALDNVNCHARAGSVEVTLQQRGDELAMRIADDGVGVPAGGDLLELEPPGHFGLVGMAERAERAGGRMELGPTPGGGTTVLVNLPADAFVRAGAER